jgi:hypothetical protein
MEVRTLLLFGMKDMMRLEESSFDAGHPDLAFNMPV